MWRNESRRRSELPADWNKIRARVLRRDNGKCVFCGAPANQVDHITPGQNHSIGNLRSLCRTCHMRRTAAQSKESRKRGGWTRPKRARRKPPPKHPGYL